MADISMNFAVICTIGRSGSTLLQGILNTAPDCTIRGENGNLLLGLFHSYNMINKISKDYNNQHTEATHPWFGAERMNVSQFIDDARKLFVNQLALPASTKMGGFKEIRWERHHLGSVSLYDYLIFIQALLPNAHFIFLTRNPKEILPSQERAGFISTYDDREKLDMIEEFYGKMLSYRLQGMPIFEIDYSDIIKPSEQLRRLFNFLSLEWDKGRINDVLSIPHSYAGTKFDQ